MAVGTANIAVVRVNEKDAAAAIFAFLKSKFGKAQIERLVSGVTVRKLTVSEISCILVPVFPKEVKKQVSDLIEKMKEEHRKCGAAAKFFLCEAIKVVEEKIEKKG